MRGVIGRLAAAVLCGLLLAAAFPLSLPGEAGAAIVARLALLTGAPVDLGYVQFPGLAFVGLVPLLLAVRGCRGGGEAFATGYVAGVVWLTLHLDWIGSFGWLPVLALAAFFALPVGLFALMMHAVIRQARPGLVVWGAATLWVAIEYLRSFGFWAFPWNQLGYTQVAGPPMLQVAELGGVFAVSFLVTLANSALFALIAPVGRFRHRLGHLAIAGVVCSAACGFGVARMTVWPFGHPAGEIRLALIQGGMETLAPWSGEELDESLRLYVPPSQDVLNAWSAMSGVSPAGTAVDIAPGPLGTVPHDAGGDVQGQAGKQPAGGPVRVGQADRRLADGPGQDLLVVWPESVLQGVLDQRHPGELPNPVRRMLAGRRDAALLMGAIGSPRDDLHIENGSVLVEPGGKVTWEHSKLRLVPYGEIVPFRGLVRFLQYPWGPADLTESRAVAPLSWRGHKLGLMICFDNVFSFICRRDVLKGAQGFVVMTNNSWYKLHSGIRQHCDIDVLRAVEYRRPLARCSTTGWSHFIAPDGRITASTAVDGPGVLVEAVGLRSGLTVYARVGDLFAQLCLLAALLICLPPLIVGRSEGFL